MFKEKVIRKPPLQPLRIEPGWTVVINNKFCELDPRDLDPNEDHWLWHFQEDTLRLVHEYYHLVLDLGWYPDGNPNGHFTLVLVKDDWDDPLFEHSTRDKQEIVELIETIICEITEIGLGRKEDRFGLERRTPSDS